MKVYRTRVIVVAVILGISFSIFLLSGSASQTAIKEPVTEEYYNLLKEEALIVAKTLDKNAISNEELTANIYFSEAELVVNVSSMKAEVTAKVPISNYALSIESGTIIFKGTAEFENVEYTENNKLKPAFWYVGMAIMMGVFLSIMLYIFFYDAWFRYKKI